MHQAAIFASRLRRPLQELSNQEKAEEIKPRSGSYGGAHRKGSDLLHPRVSRCATWLLQRPPILLPRWMPREQPPASKQTIGRSRKKPTTVSELVGSELIFSYTIDPFSFAVKRKPNGQTLFNSSSGGSDSFGENDV